MELKPRFLFHGHAVAMGGRIVHPSDLILETSASSALSAAGGRSHSQAGGTQFGKLAAFESASTIAQGLFDDLAKAAACACGNEDEPTHPATTVVKAQIRGVSVGVAPQLKIARLNVSMTARSAGPGGEPPVKVDPETAIEGVSIDGHNLAVELATAPFQDLDTHAKLLTAVDDPGFARKYGDQFLMQATVAGRARRYAGHPIRDSRRVYATIVKSITWTGAPYPGAEIDHHTVTIPKFGTIYFGEIILADLYRRLSLLRVDLKPDPCGRVMCCDVEDDGTWSF